VSTPPPPGAVAFSCETFERAALEAAWRGLETRADITFFLSWGWIGAWIDEAGMPDLVLVGRAEGGIVCLGLLRRSVARRHGFVRSRTLHLHATGCEEQDVIFIEYNGFLADRRLGAVEPQAIAFLRGRQAEIGRFDEIGLGGLVEAQYEAVRQAGFRTHVEALKSTAFVDLAALRASGGEYLATLSANTRGQIRRAVRLYEARGPLSVTRARDAGEALDYFEAMGVLHEAAWRARGESGGAWRFPFLLAVHRRIVAQSFASGGVDIVRIGCGDEVIGYIYCLVRGGWFGSYLSGFAYEADNKAKPGLVSFYLYVEHLLKSDAQVLDFLAGDHRYKTSLGTPGPRMFWLRVQERRPQLLLERALRQGKQALERVRSRRA
jgi:CelD/BcsL family acetyltransferase involved in cellulose biosynthesis